MFSEFVIGYLFLGGMGGALLVLLSFCEIIWWWRTQHANERYFSNGGACIPLRRRDMSERFQYAWALCTGILALGIVSLSLDLGRFDRLFQLILTPSVSALTLGAFALAVSVGIAGILCVFSWVDGVRISGMLRLMLGVIGVVSGIITVLYTGFLLMFSPSVLAWNTWFIPMLFGISSASCALVVGAFGVLLSTTRNPLFGAVSFLIRIDTVIIVIEVVCVGSYLIWMGYSGLMHEALFSLEAPLSSWFCIGFVPCGLIAPFLMELLLNRRNFAGLTLLIVGFVLLGGFLLRFCIVGLADFDVASELYRTTTTLVGA